MAEKFGYDGAPSLTSEGGAPLNSPAFTGTPTAPDPTTAQGLATQNYVINSVAGLLDFRGNYDASTNLFPATGGSGVAGAVLKADFWVVSVAGSLGSQPVTAGDLVVALQDTPGQTAANWDLIEHDGVVLLKASNLSDVASASTALANLGGLRQSTRQAKTGNYTAVLGDLVACDTTGGTFTVTIPAASGGKGRIVVKWVAGTIAPTINLSGSDHVNTSSGVTTFTPVLLSQGYQLESDGSAIWTVTADDLPLAQMDLRSPPITRTYLLAVNSGTTIRYQGTGGSGAANGTISPIAGTATLPYMANLASASSVGALADVATSGGNGLSVLLGASTDLFAGFNFDTKTSFPDASYDAAGASTGSRIILGLSSAVATAFAADHGGAFHTAAFCRSNVNGGATDTTFQFVTNNGGTPSVTDTTMPFTQNHLYRFRVTCPAGATSITWEVDDLTAGTTATGATSTSLPGSTTALFGVSGLETINATVRNIKIAYLLLTADRG